MDIFKKYEPLIHIFPTIQINLHQRSKIKDRVTLHLFNSLHDVQSVTKDTRLFLRFYADDFFVFMRIQLRLIRTD